MCGRMVPVGEATPLRLLRPAVAALVAADRPDRAPGGLICEEDLRTYRRRHV
ncbi:hypothetical protein [Alienimonas sp. DA493]|uniref:hypothetical protein n=1 Tax=Alienimonas sp. DA493 TaxID=3373605 RepID=UPI003753F52E